MRRDYFTLELDGLDWVDEGTKPEKPALYINYEGPASLLQERLTGESAELVSESKIDVAFRYLTSVDRSDARGVVSITDRVTGDYILELEATAGDMLAFVRGARLFGETTADEDDRYRIVLLVAGKKAVAYNKRTLLIYDQNGNLLREASLIPSGVEL